MESERKSIVIIDHTGVKSGMDKYTMAFAQGFSNIGVRATIFSNFHAVKNSQAISVQNIFEESRSNLIRRLSLRLYGYILAAVRSRGHSDAIFIHLFELTFISFFQHFLVYLINGKKIFTIYHDISAFGKDDVKSFAVFILSKFSKKVIVHNKFSKEKLLERFPFVKSNDVLIMKHGHFGDFYQEAKVPKSLKSICNLDEMKLSNKKVLLFFGQIKEEKGLDLLIDAMGILPLEYILIVAGRLVTDFTSYQKSIDRSELNHRVIKLLRFIEDDEMNYLIQNCDLVVLPYKIIYQSGVLLNTLSQESLVVASDLPPNEDIIVDGKNGFLFKSNSSTSLAEKINYIFSLDKKERKAIKIAGKNTVINNYDWNEIVESLVLKDRIFGVDYHFNKKVLK